MDERRERIEPDEFPRDEKKPPEDKAVATAARLLWPGFSVLVIDPKGKNVAAKLRRRPRTQIFNPLGEETSC
jgi:hypothetical protein